MPFITTTSARQAGWMWANASKLNDAVLGARTKGTNLFTSVIENYDSTATYNLSTTAGSIGRSGSTITVSGLSHSQSATISVYVSKNGWLTSGTSNGSGAAFTYTCPVNSGYMTLSGTTCNYPGSPINFGTYTVSSCTTTYSCPNGGGLSGTTCVAGLGGDGPGPCNHHWGWNPCGGSCCTGATASSSCVNTTYWNACAAPTTGSAPSCYYPANYAATAS